jgi:hypothetical protein
MKKPVDHIIAAGPELPPLSDEDWDGLLYQIVFAGNGTFARARRDGLEVLMPYDAHEVPMLPRLTPGLSLDAPRVPACIIEAIFDVSRAVAASRPLEALFHLHFDRDTGQWTLSLPPQNATATSVRHADDGPDSSFHKAWIEIHSHHSMPARFSGPAGVEGTDDNCEQDFRLYGVVGDIFRRPSLRMRVGLYGNRFWEIPAALVCELPPGVADCVAEEQLREGAHVRERGGCAR